jgi:hypothetical protein
MDLDALQAVLGIPRSLRPMAIGVPTGSNRILIDMSNPVESARRSAIWSCGLLPTEEIEPRTIGACCSAVENEDGSWTVATVCAIHQPVLSPG